MQTCIMLSCIIIDFISRIEELDRLDRMATFATRDLEQLVRDLAARTPPKLSGKLAGREIVRALFVPERKGEIPASDVVVVTAGELISSSLLPGSDPAPEEQ